MKTYAQILIIMLALAMTVAGCGEIDTTQHGWYDEVFHIVHCDNDEECLHEYAHKLDQESNYPSRSDAYKEAVQIYLRVAWLQKSDLDSWQTLVVEFPGIGRPAITPFGTSKEWGGYGELYAEMYRVADGDANNMPEIFRQFYNGE